MVDLVRGAETPFREDADLSGFMEWPALLIPNLRGGPVLEEVLGILKLLFTSLTKSNLKFHNQNKSKPKTCEHLFANR